MFLRSSVQGQTEQLPDHFNLDSAKSTHLEGASPDSHYPAHVYHQHYT